MEEYKRNHYIPKCLLKRWSTNNGKYDGIWGYDIKRKKKYFANAQGSNAFDFAVMNDLYIPNVGGKRAITVEKWFSQQEYALDVFVEQVNKRVDPIDLREIKNISVLLIALQSLKVRSPHDINLIYTYISKNEDIKKMISAYPDRNIERLVLENMVHLSTEQSNIYSPPKFTFMNIPGESAIVSDRPFIIDERLEVRFMILSPNTILGYEKSNDIFKYRYSENTTEAFEKDLNEQVALNSREWIAAKDSSTLDKYIHLFESVEYMKRLENDQKQVVFTPITTLTSGYSIPED